MELQNRKISTNGGFGPLHGFLEQVLESLLHDIYSGRIKVLRARDMERAIKSAIKAFELGGK
jgi:hypothetical protein